MKRPILLSAAALLMTGAAYGAARHIPKSRTQAPAVAQQAAERWLALVDKAQYDASWNTASALFKQAITQAQWTQAVRGVRAPLGTVKSRTFQGVHTTSTLPGAPDGHYAVIQYRTVFAKKAASVETITPMQDSDGVWRVSGYYIK